MNEYHTQQALVNLIKQSGPYTVRQLALRVYGGVSKQQCKLMSARVDNAQRAKLITFDGFGERVWTTGKFPSRWRAA